MLSVISTGHGSLLLPVLFRIAWPARKGEILADIGEEDTTISSTNIFIVILLARLISTTVPPNTCTQKRVQQQQQQQGQSFGMELCAIGNRLYIAGGV